MTYPITTTLDAIWKRGISPKEYNRLVRALQGAQFTKEDEARMYCLDYAPVTPIPLTFIVEHIKFEDAFWYLRTSNVSRRDVHMLSIAFARRVENLDKTGSAKKCNDINELYANGQATEEELKEARMDTQIARVEAGLAITAKVALAVAWGASFEDHAAWTAYHAELAVIYEADWEVRAAARADEREAQIELFIQMCNGKAPWQEGQP